jgi:hypothetical protein
MTTRTTTDGPSGGASTRWVPGSWIRRRSNCSGCDRGPRSRCLRRYRPATSATIVATAAPPTAAPIGKSELPLECSDVTVADVVDDKGKGRRSRPTGAWPCFRALDRGGDGMRTGRGSLRHGERAAEPDDAKATVPGTGAATVGWGRRRTPSSSPTSRCGDRRSPKPVAMFSLRTRSWIPRPQHGSPGLPTAG